MNKIIVSMIVAAFALASFADSQADKGKKYAMRMEWTERPNTQKGKIVFVDTQNLPLQQEMEHIIKKLTLRHKYNMSYVQSTPKEVTVLKKELGANVIIAIVDDDKTPTALIALEDHWGIVNVAKIRETLKTPKARETYLTGRCTKEILRVFSILCGGGASQYQGNIFNCARLDMLDYTEGMYPIDMQKKYHDYLTAIGVSPKVLVTYERACQEGWAPPPTNDVQKAIWQKVHSIPDKPLTIEYDPKKDK